MDQLMILTELARALRISRYALDKRRRAGNLGIREINIGGEGHLRMPRFRKADVEQYLRERTVA